MNFLASSGEVCSPLLCDLSKYRRPELRAAAPDGPAARWIAHSR